MTPSIARHLRAERRARNQARLARLRAIAAMEDLRLPMSVVDAEQAKRELETQVSVYRSRDSDAQAVIEAIRAAFRAAKTQRRAP